MFDDGGSWAYSSDIVGALDACRAAGADIINMSLSGSNPTMAGADAFADAFANGVLPVAAAGNQGTTALRYPASYDAVVSVAAIDQNWDHASFSQQNAQVELAAPGVGIVSTLTTGGYGSKNGTSMAAPHVSGVAALVWSRNRMWTVSELRTALQLTAIDLGAAGRDDSFGFGLVQADGRRFKDIESPTQKERHPSDETRDP